MHYIVLVVCVIQRLGVGTIDEILIAVPKGVNEFLRPNAALAEPRRTRTVNNVEKKNKNNKSTTSVLGSTALISAARIVHTSPGASAVNWWLRVESSDGATTTGLILGNLWQVRSSLSIRFLRSQSP